jgi:hypothetical protein
MKGLMRQVRERASEGANEYLSGICDAEWRSLTSFRDDSSCQFGKGRIGDSQDNNASGVRITNSSLLDPQEPDIIPGVSEGSPLRYDSHVVA